jgi:hypothetical protein
MVAGLITAAAALGVTREEFEQVAGKKTSMGSLGGALVSAGCQMALVEDAAATAQTMSRAKLRRRPLREVKSSLDDFTHSISATDSINARA